MTLKVAHIIPQLSQGGAEQLTLNIHHALNQKPNVQSKLFYFQPVADYGPPELLETQFLPAQVQLRLFSGLQGQVKELEAAIRDYAPQVLHCHLYESELVKIKDLPQEKFDKKRETLRHREIQKLLE
jgi:hypothetical protein